MDGSAAMSGGGPTGRVTGKAGGNGGAFSGLDSEGSGVALGASAAG